MQTQNPSRRKRHAYAHEFSSVLFGGRHNNSLDSVRFREIKMRLFLLILSAVAAAVLTCASQSSAQNASPTLTETLDWLKQKADAIHSVERPGIDVLNPTGPRNWEIIYSGRCNVLLKNVTSDAKSYPQMSISFSLSDLNPQSVTATMGEGVFGSQGSVNLYATAGRKILSLANCNRA